MLPLTTSSRVAGAALLALLAAGCASSPAATAPVPSAPVPSAPVASPVPGLSPTPTPEVQRLSVTVQGDSVTGDTGTVRVTRGRPVQLTVTSDVADEVHVHGADVGKDVEAGGTVVVDFVQQAPGRFEVELEKRARVLLRLQVS